MNLTLSCVDTGLYPICKYVSIKDTNIVLPPKKDFSVTTSFNIVLPLNLTSDKYSFNIFWSALKLNSQF